MAAISPVPVVPPGTIDYQGLLIVQWKNVASGDTCEPIELGKYNERSMQLSGTLGTAIVSLDGSLTGEVYETLLDHNGVPVSLDCNGVRQLSVLTRYAKPVVTGADGTTSVTITVMLKGVYGTAN